MDKSQNPERLRKERQALAQWLNTQRGRPQYRHAPHAAHSLSKVIRPLSKKHGAGLSPIIENWTAIAGKRFAKHARPIRITGGREGRTLIIKAAGPASALVAASSGQILERLNTLLGYGHIARIKVTSGAMETTSIPQTRQKARLSPLETEQLQSGLETVSDIGLKEALEKLGRAALAKSKNKPRR